MEWIITFAAFFVLILFLRASAQSPSDQSYPYELRKHLLSKAERSFYGVLSQSAPQDTVIFSKVRVADILKVKRGVRNPLSYFNKISAKHFDFVLCDVRTSAILTVIELDDSSHRSRRAAANDDVKNQAASAAGLPLLRVPAAKNYVVADLRERLLQMTSASSDSNSQESGAGDVDDHEQATPVGRPRKTSSTVTRNKLELQKN